MNPEINWKYYLGLTLFIYSFLSIFTVELLFLLPITHAEAASFALIYVGSGEISFFGAVALIFFHPTGRDLHYLVTALPAGDVIFILSLFVLGGEFREKLKKLFVWSGNDWSSAPN
ncbi:MAG TPA: hypothetical protein PK175_04735 [Syntrophales bacterium]|nr:hypothetical protein [Syntrophales bacterium]HQG34160.1 hypothetical protein [Syntrophales bacterium]